MIANIELRTVSMRKPIQSVLWLVSYYSRCSNPEVVAVATLFDFIKEKILFVDLLIWWKSRANDVVKNRMNILLKSFYFNVRWIKCGGDFNDFLVVPIMILTTWRETFDFFQDPFIFFTFFCFIIYHETRNDFNNIIIWSKSIFLANLRVIIGPLSINDELVLICSSLQIHCAGE